jgi:hypothetical protein
MSEGIDSARLRAQLEDEERRVSKRRSQIHQRIEYARTNGNGTGSPASPEQLTALDKEEREISKRRRELHAQIDALKAEQEASVRP